MSPGKISKSPFMTVRSPPIMTEVIVSPLLACA
jgi:hypothetical protein